MTYDYNVILAILVVTGHQDISRHGTKNEHWNPLYMKFISIHLQYNNCHNSILH